MKKENISLYTLLSAISLGLVCGATAYLLPQFPLVWQITGGISLAALCAYVYLARELLAKICSKKTALYGMNSVIMAVILLAIVVVINMITVTYDVKKDFTKDKIHTLSEQSMSL